MRQLIAATIRRIASFSETLEGYEQSELVDTIFKKTVAYEPDSDWPEMAGVSTVLDFGGGCGVHYKQARSPIVRWAVVETPLMVQRASELATDRLRFFTSVRDAANWLGSVDVMHSMGALQYVPDPARTLNALCEVRAKKMYWAKIALSAKTTKRENQLSLLGENGPGTIRKFSGKAVRYTLTAIPEQTFLDAHKDYSLADRGVDWFRFVLR
ncbi:putative methyltransferase, LIC12133 family [Bradyrhizobium lablabi]|uniref:Putative methyltransferase, LIC12133 family n=1 Tax=Bradyrhizobium lablabi TaxID=722472 RepID=A0A1M6NGK8_9BRAD|nr:hypothetical protein [Bradyrhizobium lablabi]SHJ94860.1 putative methyltransferase, LIC12133 family [Bradyrhizobium lablabi]